MAGKGKGTWYTPIARIKNRQEVWKRIDANGWKGQKMDLSPEMSYFNNVAVHSRILEYDSYMAYTKTFPLWDSRKPKDNTEYLPIIRENIYEQESSKPVPALTSLIYGKPTLIPYDEVETAFKRSQATGDFYRKRGVLQIEDRTEPA